MATRIFHGRELVAIARFDRFELVLAVVTLLAVALIGVEQGIGVAVGLAVLDRARLSARPQLHVLGCIPRHDELGTAEQRRATRRRSRASWWCSSPPHSGTRTPSTSRPRWTGR